jgi:restriction endonuclease Mrr
VTELRGALHHYGPAAQGWIITTGQVLSGAREEAAVLGAAPVALTDGLELARLCEQFGVGVTTTRIELPSIDLNLLDSLRS